VGVIDIDEQIVNYYLGKGFKALKGDVRFLRNSILPDAPFDVVISYQIEWFQTIPIMEFIYANLANYGELLLNFPTAELEGKTEYFLVLEALFNFRFWITELNPLFIRATKLDIPDFWNEFNSN
jgi:hypothetical protein